MVSLDEVMAELKKLRPEQVDEVARMIRVLAQEQREDAPLQPAVSAGLVDTAVQHGWPAELFRELIGSLPDLERTTQPPAERRTNL